MTAPSFPLYWFGLDPLDGEESAEEIVSSDEGGEDVEGEDGSYAALDGRATTRTQPDPAPTSDLPETTSIVADSRAAPQQPEAPPAGATPTANQSAQPEGPAA